MRPSGRSGFQIHDPRARKGQRFWRQRFRESGYIVEDQLFDGGLRGLIGKFPDHCRDMRCLCVAKRLEFDPAGTFQKLRPFRLQNGFK